MHCSCYQGMMVLVVVSSFIPSPFRVLWLLGIYCPNLQEVAYSSFEFPACAEAIWSLSCGSPDIRAIYFPPVTESEMMAHFNDHCLFRIATGFPRLRCAAVGGPSITPRGVAQFSECHTHNTGIYTSATCRNLYCSTVYCHQLLCSN